MSDYDSDRDGQELAEAREMAWDRYDAEMDSLRARLERAEADLVKTTAELVACEKERDAMRQVLADIGNELIVMETTGMPPGGTLYRFKATVLEFLKDPT